MVREKLASIVIAVVLLTLLPAAFVAPLNAYSPAPPQQWSKTFPRVLNYSVNGFPVSAAGDEGRSVIQTADGGYAIFASLNDHHYEPHTGGVDNRTSEIIKTDSVGNMQWQKGIPIVSNPYSIFQTKDSGFVLSGDTSLVKLDANGTFQWNKNFGAYFVVIQSSDGGYILAGSTNSPLIEENNANLIKTDESGNILWNMTYRDSSWSRINGVVETNGGGYAIAGQRSGSWFGLTDAYGNLTLSKNFPELEGYFNSIAKTSEGGFILVGGNSPGGINNQGQAFIAKVDSQGTTQWNHSYNNPPTAGFWFSTVVQTGDGGYVATGPSALFKIDSSGSLQWYASSNTDVENVIGSTDYVAATNDGGFIVVGAKSNSVWLAKYAPASPSPSPSPSPSVPELPSWIGLPFIVTVLAFLIIFKRRMKRK